MTNEGMIELIKLRNKNIISREHKNTWDNDDIYYIVDGKCVGICTPLGDYEFHLVIDPKYRKKGYGYKFLKKLIKETDEKVIRCSVNEDYSENEGEPMRKILKKLGFKSVGECDEIFREGEIFELNLIKKINGDIYD